MMVPLSPTAHPVFASRKNTPFRAKGVPLDWGFQLAPPSVVRRMVPVVVPKRGPVQVVAPTPRGHLELHRTRIQGLRDNGPAALDKPLPGGWALSGFELRFLNGDHKLRRIDPATVPGAGMMYAGTVGIFAYGGLSFDVARRFLAVANRYAEPTNLTEVFLVRMMSFTYHFCAGDWDDRHEIPIDVARSSSRAARRERRRTATRHQTHAWVSRTIRGTEARSRDTAAR